MIRALSFAAILAAAVAVPAFAQTTPSPSPTPAPTPPVSVSPPTPSISVPLTTSMKLNADQAKQWIGKPIYSSDDKKIGEVVSFTRSTDNTVTEMQAGIGGFLGMGETQVKLTPAQFKMQEDRVVVNVTAVQAKDLPKVQK